MMASEHRPAGLHLSHLLADIGYTDPSADPVVGGLTLDSRQVEAGWLFLACRGRATHGLDHVQQAVRHQAVAVVCEPGADWSMERIARLRGKLPIPLVVVPQLRPHVGRMAARFYGDPSRALSVAGITGTNGKTSCSHFLAQAQLPRCGIVGTLGVGFPGALRPTGHTTPDAVTLQRALATMRAEGATAVAMEVSSHALDQGRVNGVHFDVAVLTNLSRDHLDYHGDMAAYGAAKRLLFEMEGLGCAVINSDEAFGREIATGLDPSLFVVLYGLELPPIPVDRVVQWVHGAAIEHHAGGMRIQVESSWGCGEIDSRLFGDFNARNLLAVLSVLLYRGMALEQALARLGEVTTVPGRMELFRAEGRPSVIVDYAHTPDALEQVLKALRPHCKGRLVTVFGCGGERDAGKRPLMGHVAERYSDRVILTDDNPRNEDGEWIIGEILNGVEQSENIVVERKRAEAIRVAIETAERDDLILVAGKGHEEVQSIGDLELPFSDREAVATLLGLKGSAS